MWILSWPTNPEIDEMFTIAPPPTCCMAGMACFMPRKTPLAFTFMRMSQAPVLMVSGSNVPLIPALFTRTSSFPNPPTVVLTASRQSASLVTSSFTNRAWPPAPAIFSATWRPSTSRTSPTTTFAPSRAKIVASLRPMPLAPPVMSATFPASLISPPLPLIHDADRKDPRVGNDLLGKNLGTPRRHEARMRDQERQSPERGDVGRQEDVHDARPRPARRGRGP